MKVESSSRDRKKWKIVLVVVLSVLGAWHWRGSEARSRKTLDGQYLRWSMFGGGSDNIHYSSLQQINRDNVARLKVAWSYDTGDTFEGSEMQCNPIIVNGTLYATPPKMRVFALDEKRGLILRLVERPKQKAVSSGRSLYERNCASCHGRDLQGSPPEFPALASVSEKYNEAEINTVIRDGIGRMSMRRP